MKPSEHSSHRPLFPLSHADLERIERAKESARQYMSRYGQGRRPRDIHSENYINSLPGLFMLIPKQ